MLKLEEGCRLQCYWKHSSRDRGHRRVRGRSKGPDESLELLFAHKLELADRGEEGQWGQRGTNASSTVTSDWGIDSWMHTGTFKW